MVLIIGSGGREHALAWSLSRSPQVNQVWVAPGNGGTHWEGCTSLPLTKTDDLLRFALENQVALTVIGPEVPLAAGMVDAFQAAGLRVFGPVQAAAQLEASKAFAKTFMVEHGIPTAEFGVFEDIAAARQWLQNFVRPVVVKADGLAAGKGVLVCDTPQEADAALRAILEEKQFGDAGNRVVIEARLTGKEFSVLAFCDGKTVRPMLVARDYKRALDGDRGLNTGGMGAIAPAPDISQAQIEDICQRILQPVVDGMAARGTPYIGVLYAGLMQTAEGTMQVLEFNCRFGDPETQVILPLLENDLLEVLSACTEGRLHEIELRWKAAHCATVVLASGGYPQNYETGFPITGLENVNDAAMVFHAGTALREGQIVTAGGRVLAVTALGESLDEALRQAYAAVDDIHFAGMHFRRDIGKTPDRYAGTGVNIAAGTAAVNLMKSAVQSTFSPHVLSDVGNFGGLFDVSFLKAFEQPLLVASTDGVGTKTKVAAQLNRWDTIGQDLVNHCINDILVQGANPLFFMDYVATDHVEPTHIAAIVEGIATACRAAGCALLGGETAEMPGVYAAGEVDVAGTIVGVVDRAHLIDGTRIQAGDLILNLPSSGLHTNGFSLARDVLKSLDWTAHHPQLGCSVGEALLAVHRSYLDEVSRLRDAGVDIRGLAHITGGGVIDNLPRILPAGLGADIQLSTWTAPPIFDLIQTLGDIPTDEMFHVFNMGLGMLAIIPVEQQTLAADYACVGQIVSAHTGVALV